MVHGRFRLHRRLSAVCGPGLGVCGRRGARRDAAAGGVQQKGAGGVGFVASVAGPRQQVHGGVGVGVVGGRRRAVRPEPGLHPRRQRRHVVRGVFRPRRCDGVCAPQRPVVRGVQDGNRPCRRPRKSSRRIRRPLVGAGDGRVLWVRAAVRRRRGDVQFIGVCCGLCHTAVAHVVRARARRRRGGWRPCLGTPSRG